VSQAPIIWDASLLLRKASRHSLLHGAILPSMSALRAATASSKAFLKRGVSSCGLPALSKYNPSPGLMVVRM
jgi:hypothetical protein